MNVCLIIPCYRHVSPLAAVLTGLPCLPLGDGREPTS